MRGNIPRTLEMFGELRLSLFRRYFRFIFTFVFLEHLFPRLFLKQETFSSIDQLHNPHFISNRTLVFADSCVNRNLRENGVCVCACAPLERVKVRLSAAPRSQQAKQLSGKQHTTFLSRKHHTTVILMRESGGQNYIDILKMVLLMSPERKKAKLKQQREFNLLSDRIRLTCDWSHSESSNSQYQRFGRFWAVGRVVSHCRTGHVGPTGFTGNAVKLLSLSLSLFFFLKEKKLHLHRGADVNTQPAWHLHGTPPLNHVNKLPRPNLSRFSVILA